MRKILLFIPILIFVFSCTKEEVKISEDLISSENGWRVQTYSIYDDYWDRDIADHYKDLGDLYFYSDSTGKFSYDTVEISFTWSYTIDFSDEDIINIDIVRDSVTDFSSPFIFYHFAGVNGNPYLPSSEKCVQIFGVSKLNRNAFQLRAGDDGSHLVEILIYKNE